MRIDIRYHLVLTSSISASFPQFFCAVLFTSVVSCYFTFVHISLCSVLWYFFNLVSCVISSAKKKEKTFKQKGKSKLIYIILFCNGSGIHQLYIFLFCLSFMLSQMLLHTVYFICLKLIVTWWSFYNPWDFLLLIIVIFRYLDLYFLYTPSPKACQNGFAQHLEHLLFYGADTTSQNASGNTALHICALYNKVSII